VDDVWKAAAYGNMDKTKEFIEADPQLVNKPDATGYVRPTTQIPERDLRSRPMHPSIIFFRFIPNRRSSPPSPDPNTPVYAHISTAGTPGPSPHRTNAYPSTRAGSCPCSGRRSTTESRLQPTSSNEAPR
jgi:hypothetical protein